MWPSMKSKSMKRFLPLLLIAGCAAPQDKRSTQQREIVGDGTLVIEIFCWGQYVTLLWGNADQTWPAYPYCWDAEKPWVPFDFDFNGVVQWQDLEQIELCFSGPAIPYRCERNGHAIRCDMMDVDNDGDVDQNDFGLIQRQVNHDNR
jgi:hypothetical protein